MPFHGRHRKLSGAARARAGRGDPLAGLAAVLLALLLAGASPPLDAAEATARDYRLDVQDRVRLKIFEWRPSLDQVFEWTALNDEYTVSIGGTISLPMLGEIAVRGSTTSEVGKVVADSMRRRIGLAEIPQISVEVVQYRPFYIVGKVQKPGEYAYRPGLDVLQALSLAEGMMRDLSAGQRLSRELISSQGEIRRLHLRRGALDARRRRIEADLAGRNEVDFGTAGAPPDPSVKLLMDRELDILRAQRAEYDARRAQILTRQRHLAEELQSIEQQLKVHQGKTELAAEDLRNVEALVKKRLAVEPRRIGAQRNVYQVESDRLQLIMARLRVGEEVDKSVAAMLQLEQARRTELMQLLATTQAEIEDVAAKLVTADRLLVDTVQLIPGSVAGAEGLGVSPVYSILRTVDGRRQQITAEEATPVLPGDTVKVELDAPRISSLVGSRQLGDAGPAASPSVAPAPPAAPAADKRSGARANPAAASGLARWATPALRDALLADAPAGAGAAPIAETSPRPPSTAAALPADRAWARTGDLVVSSSNPATTADERTASAATGEATPAPRAEPRGGGRKAGRADRSRSKAAEARRDPPRRRR